MPALPTAARLRLPCFIALSIGALAAAAEAVEREGSCAHGGSCAAPKSQQGASLLQRSAAKVKQERPPMSLGVSGLEGGPPTCLEESLIRQVLTKKVGKSPTVIRAIFHDAADMDNLLVKNVGKKWEPLEVPDGGFGGIDGCLYSPLNNGDRGRPVPGHNRNIPNGFGWAKWVCSFVCGHPWPAGLKGTRLCDNHASCVVDMTVFGSLLTIEKAGGPKVNMTWGRQQGNCKMSEYKANPEATLALREAPALHAMDKPEVFRENFERMGFSPEEQVALMGAHTFGRVQECADGLNGVEHGPFCWNTNLNGMLNTDAFTNVFKKKKSFGDGGTFDRTPLEFDNDYFKLFEAEKFGRKDTCCGKIKRGWCHRGGTMMEITKRWRRKGGAKKARKVKGGACAVNWCRSDRKGRSHMKSTKAWVKVPAGFMKKKHGLNKRMIRLAADWALLDRDDTKAAVKTFAADQEAFFKAFSSTWGKLIKRTHREVEPCTGSATDEEVIAAKAIFNCQDISGACPRKKNKCHKSKWQSQCPRTCGRCPDQAGSSLVDEGIADDSDDDDDDDYDESPGATLEPTLDATRELADDDEDDFDNEGVHGGEDAKDDDDDVSPELESVPDDDDEDDDELESAPDDDDEDYDELESAPDDDEDYDELESAPDDDDADDDELESSPDDSEDDELESVSE